MNICGHDERKKRLAWVPNLRIPHVTLRQNSQDFTSVFIVGESGSLQRSQDQSLFQMSAVCSGFQCYLLSMLTSATAEGRENICPFSYLNLKHLPKPSFPGFPYPGFAPDLPFLKNGCLSGAIFLRYKREKRKGRQPSIQVSIYSLCSFHQNPSPGALMQLVIPHALALLLSFN